MRKMLAIITSLMLLMSVMTGTTAVAYAAEQEAPEVSQWEVESEGLENVSITSDENGFVIMANGPIGENPTGTMAGEDAKEVTGSAVFYIRVPDDTTLNRLYCIAGSPYGYITNISVLGVGGQAYIARSTGSWYRVSPTNMGIAGGTTLALIVDVADQNNPYNIVIAGRH